MRSLVLELLSTKSTQEESMMDRAASAGFEGIAQMLLEQKKLMDALEAENRELRRQLADLRRGIGIAVIIEGKTVQLATEAGMSNTNGQALQSLQSLQATPPPTMPSTPTQAAANYSNQTNGRTPASGQPPVNVNNDKREPTNGRSPLADSFVL
jgi:hypothetical protein